MKNQHEIEAQRVALAALGKNTVTKVQTVDHVARLWGGMGYIYRIHYREKNDTTNKSLIVKRIECVKPQSFGDKRKAKSYEVECQFYSEYSSVLSKLNICCEGLLYENDGQGSISIAMKSLPHPTIGCLQGNHTLAAIRSVARLHAFFWGDKSIDAVTSKGLASQGTYWYLDTRPDEFEHMSNRGFEGKLRSVAHQIDEALKNHPYQTCVHGDLKSCNMSMSIDPDLVCFVDFQYIGRSCAAKDLAYLFVCGLDVHDDFEENMEEELLKLYVDEMTKSGVEALSLPLLKKALNLAYIDLYRWMCGWGVWGNGFLPDRVMRCLDEVLIDISAT